MINISKIAATIFSCLVFFVTDRTRLSFTIKVEFEGCPFLIRPFILLEIIMVSGRWEPYVRRILDSSIGSNDVIIDVGAHIGIYAVPFAKRAAKVVAFEPDPNSSEILLKNIRLNALNNITLIRKPVGSASENVRFNVSPSSIYSRVTSNESSERVGEHFFSTETVDLDSCLANESRITWLIIDVEGFEAKVLMGAKSILKNHSPRIIIEIFNQREVGEILSNYGYKMEHLLYSYYYAAKDK